MARKNKLWINENKRKAEELLREAYAVLDATACNKQLDGLKLLEYVENADDEDTETTPQTRRGAAARARREAAQIKRAKAIRSQFFAQCVRPGRGGTQTITRVETPSSGPAMSPRMAAMQQRRAEGLEGLGAVDVDEAESQLMASAEDTISHIWRNDLDCRHAFAKFLDMNARLGKWYGAGGRTTPGKGTAPSTHPVAVLIEEIRRAGQPKLIARCLREYPQVREVTHPYIDPVTRNVEVLDEITDEPIFVDITPPPPPTPPRGAPGATGRSGAPNLTLPQELRGSFVKKTSFFDRVLKAPGAKSTKAKTKTRRRGR